jgi:hypothetical protein
LNRQDAKDARKRIERERETLMRRGLSLKR